MIPDQTSLDLQNRYKSQLSHLEMQSIRLQYSKHYNHNKHLKHSNHLYLTQSVNMKLFIAAALFTLGLAAPVTETETKPQSIAARAFTCPGGLTNSSPMCCSVNVLGLLSLDCTIRKGFFPFFFWEKT